MFQLIGDFLFLDEGLSTGMVLIVVFIACLVVSLLFYKLISHISASFKEEYSEIFIMLSIAAAMLFSFVLPLWVMSPEKLAEYINGQPDQEFKKCLFEKTLTLVEKERAVTVSYAELSGFRKNCGQQRLTNEFKEFAESQLDKVNKKENAADVSINR